MFETLFAKPIYNLYIYLIGVDWINAGLALIITTIVIKIILFPFQKKQIKSQIAMKKAQPELDQIKKEFKGITDPVKKQQMGAKMMAVYKKYNLNPFAPLLIMIIQIPILFALYRTFMINSDDIVNGTGFIIDKSRLYFDTALNIVDMQFLGISLLKTNMFIAALAAITQYLYMHITMPEVKLSHFFKKTEGGMKENFGNSLKVNMKFGLPVFVFLLLSFSLNAALGLYWVTSNLFLILQEYLVRKDKQELKNI